MNDKSFPHSGILSLTGKIFLLCILAACLSGCYWHSTKEKVEMAAATTSYEPRVYIHPASADLSRASIAVPPFQLPGNIPGVRGEEVAALFQQTLLSERAFHKVKLIADHYGSQQEAIDLARNHGVDLVLTGRINYVLAGSSLGGGRLNLSLRIIDLVSSNTVWYVEQTVDQAMTYPDNSFPARLGRIFSSPPVPESTSTPTIPVMLARISSDITRVIKSGTHPPL